MFSEGSYLNHLCIRFGPACYTAHFYPLRPSDYRNAKLADALLCVVGIIGILGLTDVIPIGSTAGWCLTGCGGGAALILTLYLIRDRHKTYVVQVCEGVRINLSTAQKVTVCASQKVSILREKLSMNDRNKKFHYGKDLDENKTFGEQSVSYMECSAIQYVDVNQTL